MMPARGKLYVRAVETGETLPGSRIILTQATRDKLTSCQVEVIAVGYPALCNDFPECERNHIAAFHAPVGKFPDEPHYHPHGVGVGDWVVVTHRSLSPTHQDNLYCCHQDDVLARFNQ